MPHGRPVVPREDRLRNPKGVHELDDILSQRGLLSGAWDGLAHEPGVAVPAQVGHDDAEACVGQDRGDLDVAVDVVGEPVQQQHGWAVCRAGFEVGDVEVCRFDVSQRLEVNGRAHDLLLVVDRGVAC